MYGKRRVVLGSKLTRSGKRIVSVTGGKAHFPIGFWYESGGLFYADLKSGEQQYQLISNDDLAYKGLGGCPTKQGLREFVMRHFNDMRQEG